MQRGIRLLNDFRLQKIKNSKYTQKFKKSSRKTFKQIINIQEKLQEKIRSEFDRQTLVTKVEK